jgi:uncharacterized metal-binding protein YceD (DUF177 family)
MQTPKDYIIKFIGLSVGQHEFEFDVNDKFFEGLDYSEIKQGNIRVKITLLKQAVMMALQFEINGTIKANCDLCTGEFDLPINGNFKLIVKVGGNDAGTEDDDIITIAANEYQLDLSQYIYEYIALSLPIKRVHPDNKKGESTCDKEMLKKLENFIVEDEGEEEEETTDPRWEQLKKIKLN